jgi:ribosomal protein S18 acetylase RimI-like enzyme
MAGLIRRGNAADAQFLAWVMLSASRAHLSRGVWDLILGTDQGANEAASLDYLRRLALAEPRSLYHYESFLIAELDNVPCAALCAFEPRDAWFLVGDAMANVQRDLQWTEEQAAASYRRVGPIWASCMPPDIGADFVIENVASLPEFRRRGLVHALIEEALQDAGRRGCKLAQISLYIGNDAARLTYEKSGFRVRDEKRCSDLEKVLGVPGFMRLTRELR